MSHPKLDRGIVWCRTCGRSERVNARWLIWQSSPHNAWPKCHGETMTIDSPEERAAMVRDPQTPRADADDSLTGGKR